MSDYSRHSKLENPLKKSIGRVALALVSAAMSVPGLLLAEVQESAPEDTVAGAIGKGLSGGPELDHAADLGAATYVDGDLQVLSNCAEPAGCSGRVQVHSDRERMCMHGRDLKGPHRAECAERDVSLVGGFSVSAAMKSPVAAETSVIGTRTCERNGVVTKDGTWQLDGSVPITVEEVPLGSLCTVQQDDPRSRAIIPWRLVVPDASEVTEVVANALPDATVLGAGSEAATLGAAYDSVLEFTDEFSGSWACEYDDDHLGGTWYLADGHAFESVDLGGR